MPAIIMSVIGLITVGLIAIGRSRVDRIARAAYDDQAKHGMKINRRIW